jgi:hypothetical protein
MIGPIDPVEARKGTFIVSFPLDQLTQLEGYMVHVEIAAERNGIEGIFVYTRMARWGKKSRNDTWQAFLMPPGWTPPDKGT